MPLFPGFPMTLMLLLLGMLVPVQGLLINSEGGRYYTCQYELVPDIVSREEATVRCEKKGGKLAIVTSADHNEEVMRLLKATQQKSAWIGLYLTDTAKQWDDGTALGYSKLNPAARAPASGANVIASVTGSWYLVETKAKAPYICTVNRAFMLISQPLTHSSSSAMCSQNQMTLARVTKPVQAREVRRMITRQGGFRRNHWFWVDGENPTARGIWQWSDGSPALGLRWSKSDVIPREGPLYVAFNKRSGRHRALHDYFLNPSICQCQAPKEPKSPAQQDYGLINSQGEYVPLFRTLSERKLRVVGLEHDHDSSVADLQRMSYSYHKERLTHGAAQSFCRSLSGDLACPRTPLQQTRILSVIRSNSWLGVVGVDEEGVWRCVGDSSILTYTHWFQGFGFGTVPEPDNMTDRMKPGAAYVQILYDPDRRWRHGQWIDRGAPQYEFVVRSAFVCEFSR